jgi:hypothetical protein
MMQFAKIADGEQLCRCCTHRKLWLFKNIKFSPEKSQILICDKWAIRTVVTLLWQMGDMCSCDSVVTNGRYVQL